MFVSQVAELIVLTAIMFVSQVAEVIVLTSMMFMSQVAELIVLTSIMFVSQVAEVIVLTSMMFMSQVAELIVLTSMMFMSQVAELIVLISIMFVSQVAELIVLTSIKNCLSGGRRKLLYSYIQNFIKHYSNKIDFIYTDESIGNYHCGFLRNLSTTDHIFWNKMGTVSFIIDSRKPVFQLEGSDCIIISFILA